MKRFPLRSHPEGPEEEVLFDLMRKRAVYGLDADETRELDRLARLHPDVDFECYDRAAAALDIVYLEGRTDALPEDLRRRVAAAAPIAGKQVPAERAAPAVSAPNVTAPAKTPPTGPRRMDATGWAGWIVAAAATIVAILGWTRDPEPRDPARDALALQREVDAAPDRIVVPWKATEDPAGRNVTGDLHWSTALQKGYMRFRGLPANDPTQQQYQLWIFDAPRGTDHPVDGGVFDVAQGEVIVPIDAKIRVDDPSLFAVTAEIPGGVVVSKRERIVSLAEL